ncbi:MAG: hypothetical protein BWY59_01568 [Verrucomicrobia bacterium ADurb.Bin345]|nr:MAG: hypothetical protein BWY59_01568 [Verrucomicrobia bacterium ADurb.Bin345]
MAAFLVFRVIAAGAIGTRNREFGLLEIERPARKVHAHGADGDHAALLSHAFCSEVDRIVGRRGRGDQHGVGAELACAGEDLPGAQSGLGEFRTHTARQLTTRRDGVGAQHPTLLRLEQRNGQLADEAEADHKGCVAELYAGQPDTLERDGAEHGERRVVERHIRRHMCTKMTGDAHDTRVRSVGSHAVTGLKPLNPRTACKHDAGGRVAHRHRRIEFLGDLREGVEEAFLFQLLDDAAHVVGAFARLAEERFARQFDRHLLRAGGNERESVGDQDVAGFGHRRGNRAQIQLSVADVLNDLLHWRGIIGRGGCLQKDKRPPGSSEPAANGFPGAGCKPYGAGAKHLHARHPDLA